MFSEMVYRGNQWKPQAEMEQLLNSKSFIEEHLLQYFRNRCPSSFVIISFLDGTEKAREMPKKGSKILSQYMELVRHYLKWACMVFLKPFFRLGFHARFVIFAVLLLLLCVCVSSVRYLRYLGCQIFTM